VIVREYRSEDEDACRALFAELVEAHRELYPDGGVGGTFELPERVFVAEADGAVVGYAGLIAHGKRCELEPIVVSAAARGRGAGRALAERVVAEARASGAIGVFVRPVGRNASAIAFFRSVGFDVLAFVRLQIDFDERERHPGETIAGVEFLV
jgi:ribosomal protein S18 acetylase RimI-like enzyme